MSDLIQDLRFSCRQLWSTRGFTLLATGTLALGIGANTAVFSVLDPLLIRTLPVHEPERLVTLQSTGTLGTNDTWWPSAFDEFRAATHVLSGIAGAAGPAPVSVGRGDAQTQALATSVTANYFEVLGVQPHVGRVLAPADDTERRAAAVLSYDYWAGEFAEDRAVVGRTVQMGAQPYEVVGVAPRGFLGTVIGAEPDLFITAGAGEWGWTGAIARLAPGVSAAEAQGALAPLLPRLLETSGLVPASWPQLLGRLVVVPAARGTSELRDRNGQATVILMGIVALVLLIACINVANLGLSRAAGRRVATGVQLALGAPRSRLVRQVLFETTLITAAGAGAGLLAAGWAAQALVSTLTAGEPIARLATGLDTRVAVFTGVTMALTILLSGLWPALATSRVDVLTVLKPCSAGNHQAGRHSALRRSLIVGQVALSVVLLAGAGTLVRSFINLTTHDLGFDDRRVVAVSLRDSATNRPAGQATQVMNLMLERLSNLPGVEAASFNSLVPLTPNEIGVTVGAEPGVSVATSHTFFTYIAPAYFETMGIRLVAGDDFAAETPSSGPIQVIINQTLGRHLFGDDNPIGQFVRFLEGARPPMEIIGVASDAAYNAVREEQRAFMYVRVPVEQWSSIRGALVVRSMNAQAGPTAGAITAAISSVDPSLAVTTVRSLRSYVDDSLVRDRLIASLALGFSVLALSIAAVGLFGVLAIAVSGQTKEIGLRMALGADSLRIARFVAGPAITLLAAGLVVGLVGATLAAPVLSGVLFGLETVDAVTMVSVAVTLAVAAVVACYVPARRAVRIDPAETLRGE